MRLIKILGTHIIAEFIEVDSKLLKDKEFIINVLLEACKKSGATILGEFSYKFDADGGVTAFVPLAESHCSFHSWSEYGYIACDAYTCGTHVNPHVIVDYIHEKFGGSVATKQFDRGMPYKEDTYGRPEPIE